MPPPFCEVTASAQIQLVSLGTSEGGKQLSAEIIYLGNLLDARYLTVYP